MKPLLKWAGGKARLAPQISDAFEHGCEGTYFEPFLGSAAVYLHRFSAGEIGEAVLSDANHKLIEFHRCVRDCLDDLLDELSRMPDEEYREAYYGIRELFNAGPAEGPLHAARFLWLNRAGFNGLYRENKRGDFNVPVGRYKAVRMPDEARFREVSRALQAAELRVGGFDDLMKLSGRGDQIYCDPPYVPLTATADFTGYHKSPFGLAEQQDLAHSAIRAAFRGASVVLSNHDLPVVRNELYPESSGFRHVARPPVSRAISRSVNTRKAVREVIAAIGPLRLVA